MTGAEIVLGGFGVLAVVAGLLAVTSRQVVHAALWLVVSLGAVAGVYLALGAQVVAMVQLLVYVGAIVVLVLFALMLTRAPIGRSQDLDAGPSGKLLAALAGLAVAGMLGGVLTWAVGDLTVRPDLARSSARALGEAIFGGWLAPFELLSVLLLAALVGALAVSRGPARPTPARPSTRIARLTAERVARPAPPSAAPRPAAADDGPSAEATPTTVETEDAR